MENKLTAQELRIGNLVVLKNIGICWVAGLDKIDNTILPIVSNEKREFKVNKQMIEAIPLTEEWLLKFGFEVISKNSAGKVYSIVNNGVFSSDLKFIFWETTEEKGKIFRHNLEIKSAHQLQNLYFALTNEELTIK